MDVGIEDFSRLKDSEPYVRYCWSFGNNGRDYLYSKEIEPYKKAWHYAIYFHDYSLEKPVMLNSGASLKAIEKLFIPEHQKELWKSVKPKVYRQLAFSF